MKKFLLALLAVLFISFEANATHIVGSTLTYVHNGGSSYTFTLKLYRDCGAGSAAFPGSVTINVRGYNGLVFNPSKNFTMPGGVITVIPSNLDTCAVPPTPMPCVEERIYTATVTNLPPNPGGYHCYYQVCCRNLSTTNVDASCNCIGSSVYTYIPGPSMVWFEDFTGLANGTTNDAGPTAWSSATGVPAPTLSSVQANLFEVQGANSASAVWSSQQINIAAYTAGVNLSVDLTEVGTLDAADSIITYYSLNSGPLIPFTTNGTVVNDFTALTATSGPLTGNTVQIVIRVHYDASSPSSEIYRWDNVTVYGNDFVSNSSPVFNLFPPLFLCQGNFFSFNHAATDPDGDSLVYSFYTPYNDPAPTYTANTPTFTPVVWLGGFSATNPLGGAPLGLNSSTGVMTGTPTMLGQFVVGVKVQEYRNSVLLSEMTRDFQFNITFCPPPAQALIVPGDTINACSGLSVTFPNNSDPAANNWTWDFGNIASTTDTSTLEFPTYAYPSPGSYTTMLIINAGTSCADTSYASVDVGFANAAFTHNAPQCAGTNVTFTNSSTCSANTTISGYSWDFGDATTSTLQNPTHAYSTGGSYTVTLITYTTLGCTDTLAVPITISPTPATPAPASNSPICAGNTLNLTTNAVAGATYSWTGPNGFTSALQNPSIAAATVAAAGTYSLTITVAGCTSAAGTVAVTVNPTPAAPTAGSNSPICAGSTLNLTASNIAGATYSWTGPNGFTSASQNPSIAAATTAASGTYSVVATVAGCPSAAGTVAVTVSPVPATPTAASNSPVCQGSTINLTTPLVAGATYSWTGPNGFTSAVQNPTIPGAVAANAGTYSVTITVGGCASAAGTTAVVVNPTPATPAPTSNSPVCVGATITLNTTAVAGATYSWTGPGGFTSALQNPTRPNATLAMAGTYSVTVTVGGCTSAAGTVAVTVNPTPAAPTASSNTPICAGSTLNLSASAIAGATYSWTGPNSFTSAVQNPSITGATVAASGTYSVTATVGGCTSAFGTTTVVVNPVPAAPAPGSNSPVCSGSTLTLTTTAVAGATYSWTGPNSFSSALQNPTIAAATTAATGTYSLTVTVAGCTSAPGTVAVVVNPTPAAPTASSNSPVCAGSTLNLSASAIAGATYSWTGPNGFTSATQNPSIAGITAAGAGTYSVTATVGGCTGTFGTTTVVVNPIPTTPTASSNSPICVGQTLNLSTSAVAGATYSWTGPNGFTSAVQNPSIAGATAAATGTYSLTITVGGCTSAAGTVSVTVNSAPATPIVASNSPLCAGGTLNLTSNFVAGAIYTWTGPNGFTSSLQNPSIPSVTTAATGTYTLVINNGCASPSATVAVTINPTPAAPTASSNSPICDGSTLNLTASNIAGATYSWTGPNSFTSAVQNPSIAGAAVAASGTYSVTATVGGCTSAFGTATVVVNPIPAAPSPGSNSPVCTGSTITLTTTAVAGATYSWTGPAAFTSSLQNPTRTNATLAMAGTYSLTVTVNGCTSSAGTVTVVVNATPAAPTASSNSPICAGSTLNLSASAIAGASYTWTGPNGFTSAVQNPSITGATTAASGTYSVTATVAGCTGTFGTTTVVVNPIPAAPTPSSNSPICIGATLNLTTTAVAGATYSWTGPNGFTSAVQNPSIAAVTSAEAGTYSLTVTVNGCTSPAGTVNVIINNPPSAPTVSSNSPVCTGGTLNLTASLIIGSTYSWTGPNGFTSTLQNPSITGVTAAAAGTYTVIVNNGCASSPATTTVVVNATPAAPTASSNSPLCDGSTINLSATNVVGATYSWTGPAGFTAATQNATVPGATALNAGTYSVNVTVNGCTSTNATTNVVVNPIPAAPSPSSNSPVCTGTTLSLTTSAVAGATYTWTGPNGFTSSLQNPSIANVTLAADGTYSLTVTVLGCTSSAGTVVVTVNATPAAPAASSNSPICDGDALNLTAGAIAGATYAWTGPNSFTSATQNPTISPATLAEAGTYSVTATVNGCTGAAGTTTVVVNPIPATPAPSSNGPICVGQTLNLTTSAVAGATYSWIGPNGFTSSLQNPSIPSATTAASGTYSLTVTVNGCTSPAGTVVVLVSNNPPSPVVTSNSPVCTGQTIQLSADTVAGATYTWSGPNSFSSTLQNPTISPATLAASGTYTVVVFNGCASAPATVSVTVNPTPAIPVANSNSPVCEGSTINLTSNLVAGATYAWSGPNGFTAATQNTSVPNATSVEAGTYSVTVTVNGCTSAPGTEIVSVDPTPLAGAGSSQSVCANNATVSLNATSTTGSGTWTTSGTGTFSPSANLLNPTYTPSSADTAAGSVTLTFTTTNNGACTADNDQITITFTDAPTANAGPDQTVCANNADVSLNGVVTIAGGGDWTSTGTGTFTPSSSTLNATYTPSAADTAAGTITLYLTTTLNGGCLPAVDSMIVTITDGPTVDAGPTVFRCSNNPNGQLNGSSSTGTGTWTTSGTGTFNPNQNTLNATYVPSAADVASGSVLFTLTSTANGNCNAVSDTVSIIFTQPPAVTAGSDITVCANAPSVPLSGTSTTGNGTWTTSGTGTFSPNGLNGNYIPSAADTAAGTVTLTLTSTNNGGCLAVTDQLVITITDAPVVTAGADINVCGNNPTVNLNGNVTIATGGIWSTTGSGTFSPSNTDLSASYSPSGADTAAGVITIYLTSTGNGLCNAVIDSLLVTITDAPYVVAGDTILTCISSPDTPLNGTSSTGSGLWSTMGTGTFNPNNTTLNATYVPSAADTTAGQVVLVLTSTNNGTCLAEDDTVLIIFTPVPVVTTTPDQTVCANNAVVTVGATSTTGTGIWSTSGSGTFTPSTSNLTPTYTPSSADTAAGSVVLTFTSTNGCTPISSTITITISDAPFVVAGPDLFTCANNPNAQITGAAVGGATTTGIWTTSGGGFFSPSNTDINPTYLPDAADIAAGSVTLVLSSTGNGLCLPASDTVILTITPPPTATAGTDLVACANNPVSLSGTITGGNGTGVWTTPDGTGTFSPSPSDLNASYTPTNFDTLVSPVMVILTSTNNGGCLSSSDTLFITVNPGPEVTAGPDQTVCANNGAVNLNGTMYLATGVVWSTSGDGQFAPDSISLSATYTPGPLDTTAGSVSIYITSTGNGLCNPAVDSMLITITDAPFVDAGPSQSICTGIPDAQLNGSVGGGASSGVWTTTGTGTFAPDDSTLNAVYTFSPADTVAGTVMMYLTSTNNGLCNAVMDSMMITITPLPNALAGNDTTICGDGSGFTLNGVIQGGSGAGVWTTSGDGTFAPNDSTLNAVYTPGPIDTANGTVTLILNAVNACLPEADTVVITIVDAPIVSAGTSALICAGESVNLGGTVANTTGGTWSTAGDGTFAPNATTLNATYVPGPNDIAAGSVTVTLTADSTSFCSSVSDAITITINSKPEAAFLFANNCELAPTVFTDSSTNVNGAITAWNWTFDAATDTAQNPSYTFPTTGSHTVTLVVTTAAGCADTLTQTMIINPAPTAFYSDTTICPFDGVYSDGSFIASGNITTWDWNFGDSTFSNLQNPTHTYSDTGTFIVTLAVTSDSGCVSVFSDTTFIELCSDTVTDPVLPGAFTPNGDGHNDVFIVRGGPMLDMKLSVYNEWDNLVFTSDSQAVGWDGTYKGKPQPAGTYIWTLTGTTADGTPVNMYGSVTILR